MTKRERKERRWQKCRKKRRCKRLFGSAWAYAMQFDPVTGKRVVFKARSVGLSTLENLMGNHCKGTQ